MKLSSVKCDMYVNLQLTEKEVRMLGWLAGYGGKAIAKAIHGELTREFDEKEWEKLWEEIRGECERTTNHMKDVREVFMGTKRAANHQVKEREYGQFPG